MLHFRRYPKEHDPRQARMSPARRRPKQFLLPPSRHECTTAAAAQSARTTAQCACVPEVCSCVFCVCAFVQGVCVLGVLVLLRYYRCLCGVRFEESQVNKKDLMFNFFLFALVYPRKICRHLFMRLYRGGSKTDLFSSCHFDTAFVSSLSSWNFDLL